MKTSTLAVWCLYSLLWFFSSSIPLLSLSVYFIIYLLVTLIVYCTFLHWNKISKCWHISVLFNDIFPVSRTSPDTRVFVKCFHWINEVSVCIPASTQFPQLRVKNLTQVYEPIWPKSIHQPTLPSFLPCFHPSALSFQSV